MKMKGKENDNIKIKEAEQFYASFLKYTQSVFTGITDIGVLDIDFIAKKIKNLWNEVRHNRRFLLLAHTCIEPANEENYLASHSVRSTVISMIIGSHFKLANHRLMELGISALLHDIGMLKMPAEMYLKEQGLTSKEKKLIYTHPVLGYKMLQSLKCPLAISLAVLEHHERENGSGYPRKLQGESISLYGKIIAAACSYEALTSKRLYKKAKDHHSGIVELLKNEGRQYDGKVIMALTASLSIYPIGMYVLLTDGKHGRVYDINPVNQRYPVVRVLESKGKEEKKLVWTSEGGVSIVRPLTGEEVEVIKDSYDI